MAKKDDKSRNKSWWQGLKAEFHKISWTSRDDLIKQTIAVVLIAIVLTVLISVLDQGILKCVNLLETIGYAA